MKLLAISCLLALAVSTKADGGLGLEGLVYAPGHASVDYYAYPAYAFEYSVKDPHTGDNKAQWEKRDGDVVKGAYSLVEPDGSVRVVEYYADDKTGFNAVVKRLGPNLHPTGHAVAPIYKAPLPVIGSGHIAPLTVGPVAKYEHLAAAPLISGPISAGHLPAPYYGHGAISSASLYKAAPIVKHIAPAPIIHEPILPAPIIKSAPIISEPHYGPILKGPLYGPGPILKDPLYGAGPILKEPFYGPGPILKDAHYGLGPILKEPLHGHGPILKDAHYGLGPILKEPLVGHGPILKEPYYGPGPILKEPYYGPGPILKHGPILDLPGPIIKHGPIAEFPYGGLIKAPLGDLGHGLLEKGPLLSGWGGPYLGLKH